MFPAGNIPLGAREDRCPARRRTIERSSFRRAEGWIARRGDFLLPAFVCFFGAFFAQAKKAEFPKLKKAQEKILQIRRFAGDGQCEGNGLPQPLAGLRNDDRRECISARRKTSSASLRSAPSPKGKAGSGRFIGDRTRASGRKHFKTKKILPFGRIFSFYMDLLAFISAQSVRERRTWRGFAPSDGPMMPRLSIWSMMRPARA